MNFSYNWVYGIFGFLKSFKYSESRICSIVILSSGFLFKHPLTISWISSSVYTGRSLYLQSRMFYFIYSSELLMKGESPIYNSYKIHPSDHMSAEKVYFFPSRTSGAIVWGEPPKVLAILLRLLKYLAKPRSAIFITFYLVNKILCDFRSRWITFLSFMNFKPKQI